jgi:hypothetical protein
MTRLFVRRLKIDIYIIGSRSIWILGSSVVYWAGKEAVSRQGGRHLGLHNVGFQGFWFGKRVWKELKEVHSFTNFFNRFAIGGIMPVSSLQYIGPYNKHIWH